MPSLSEPVFSLFPDDAAVARYRAGEEELEVPALHNPAADLEDDVDTEPGPVKEKKKKKSTSGKHKAKKRKKKKKKKKPAKKEPTIKLEPGSVAELARRDYSTLTPAEQVEVDNAPPEISTLEMQLSAHPNYKSKLYALARGDLTEFVSERPTDLRVVRDSFPDVQVL